MLSAEIRVDSYPEIRNILRYREKDFRGDRARVTFNEDYVLIEARDVPAFRACFNTLTRYMKIIYSLMEIFKKGEK